MKSNKAVVKMMKPPTEDESIAPLIQELLGRLGEDPKRDGLERTPLRVDKALRFLTSGYQMKIGQILNGALYEVKYDEMRGVEKQHSGAMTSAMLGAFRDRKETRDEFLALVNHRTNGY